MTNIFERAAKAKVRFDHRGRISTEDLFDLPLEQLNKLYALLRVEQRALVDDSLLEKDTKEKTMLNLQVDLVKHVFKAKQDEQTARETRAERKMQREKIAAVIEEMKDEGLKKRSIEDLEKAMIELKD